VRYVPGWFPGAGFQQFAKTGQELFAVAVDGPFDFVKESMEVSLPVLHTHISVLGLNDVKANGTNVSIAALCFDRVAELADQGFDENVIRAMTATMYIGKTNSPKLCFRVLIPDVAIAASDTVRICITTAVPKLNSE